MCANTFGELGVRNFQLVLLPSNRGRVGALRTDIPSWRNLGNALAVHLSSLYLEHNTERICIALTGVKSTNTLLTSLVIGRREHLEEGGTTWLKATHDVGIFQIFSSTRGTTHNTQHIRLNVKLTVCLLLLRNV
jgi:hypothetical protein